MAQDIWKAAATMIAAHIRAHHHDFQRGLLLIPRAKDDTVIVWVFGNDGDEIGEEVEQEINLIRERVPNKALEELGCGFSADRRTWVLVLRTSQCKYRTRTGKAFHLEMLKSWLDDTVQDAWRVTHRAEQGAGITLTPCLETVEK